MLMNSGFKSPHDALPILLHGYTGPAIRIGFIVEPLRENADFAVRQILGGAVGIFPVCIVVEDQNGEPLAIPAFVYSNIC